MYFLCFFGLITIFYLFWCPFPFSKIQEHNIVVHNVADWDSQFCFSNIKNSSELNI